MLAPSVRHRLCSASAGADLFRSAFLRACTETARLDVAVSVAASSNDHVGATRASLVASIRDRRWEQALSLCTQLSSQLCAEQRRHCKQRRDGSAAAAIYDLARLSVGASRLLERIESSASFRSGASGSGEPAVEGDKSLDPPPQRTSRALLLWQREQLTALRADGALPNRVWWEALQIMARRGDFRVNNNNNPDERSRHGAAHQHRRAETRDMTTASSQQQQQQQRGDDQAPDFAKWSPSERQTELTRLLRRARANSHRAMRAGSATTWQRAVAVCFPPADRNAGASPNHSVHAGHVNALLGVLYEEGRMDLCRTLALEALQGRQQQQEGEESDDGRGAEAQLLPPSFRPTAGTVMVVAEVIKATRDARLAECLLSPRCRARDEVFPFAAWAACDTLNKARGANWAAALEWWSSAVVPNADSSHKFRSHLKLTSCIASILVRRAGVASGEAIAVMSECTSVPGYQRVVESIIAQQASPSSGTAF